MGSNTQRVCSEEKVSVDIVKMKHAHNATGTRPVARRALAAAASAPESLAIGEQGADCATVGIPPL